MHRFFIPKESFMQDEVIICGEPLHQIGYVLRLKPGDRIIILDNSGCEYEVEIEKQVSQRSLIIKEEYDEERGKDMVLKKALKKAGFLIKETFKGFIADNALQLSAALSYYTIFALPPLLIIIISLIRIGGL